MDAGGVPAIRIGRSDIQGDNAPFFLEVTVLDDAPKLGGKELHKFI